MRVDMGTITRSYSTETFVKLRLGFICRYPYKLRLDV